MFYVFLYFLRVFDQGKQLLFSGIVESKIFTDRMPQSGKLPVLNLLTGQKIWFFATQGRLVAPIRVKLCRADGHLGPLGCAKFHLNRLRG